jgi:3-oxoacyl-[acyl-carrier protein] reductase
MHVGRLKGRFALVTGGGRGIGAATARLFAKEGAVVGIMGKGEESLTKSQAAAKAEGLEIETFVGDVSVKADVERVVESFVKKFGRIDILVNNAGMTMPRAFPDKTEEEWMRVLQVNLIGPFLCSQAAAAHMRKAGSGKIVNVTSVRGVDHCGRAPVLDYSAAKAGLVNMTKTLAKELAPIINVNAVAPGHTSTDILASLPEETKKGMLAGTPLDRFAQPDDIAQAILFLSSAESNFITGQQLVVDGGFSLKAG